MNDLSALLAAFTTASGCEAAIWSGTGDTVVRDAGAPSTPRPSRLPTVAEGAVAGTSQEGATLIAAIPGPGR
ncbi:MAG TPA: hypothetical protein VF483_03145, partial [Gemmatimonadaceae bacterium]